MWVAMQVAHLSCVTNVLLR